MNVRVSPEIIGVQHIRAILKCLGKLKYRNGQTMQAQRSIHNIKTAMFECKKPDAEININLSDLLPKADDTPTMR